MHPLRLQNPLSDAAPAAEARTGNGAASRLRPWGEIGKGVAAFVVGILIGASTILVAEIVTPAGGTTTDDVPASVEQGPLQLRR
jgi:hypothetical protein